MLLNYFLDSSIIIEAFKGNKNAVEIIYSLKSLSLKKIYINEVVWSETVYQLSIKIEDVFLFLGKFFFLNINLEVIEISKDFIINHNLKPNDALISLDRDFEEASSKESVVLINSIDVLGNI